MKLIGYYTAIDNLSLNELKCMAPFVFDPIMQQQIQTKISQIENENIQKKNKKYKPLKIIGFSILSLISLYSSLVGSYFLLLDPYFDYEDIESWRIHWDSAVILLVIFSISIFSISKLIKNCRS